MSALSDLLRARADALGMGPAAISQALKAREIKAEPSAVSQWLAGSTRPTGDKFDALSVVLDLAPGDIVRAAGATE